MKITNENALRLLLPFLLLVCLAAVAPAEETDGYAEPTGIEIAADAPEIESGLPDAAALLRGIDELFESTGTTAHVEITIVTPKKTRTMRMRFWSKDDDHALMVVDSPPRDAGTATLRVEQNLWNYLPKISRTIRVPPSMMMGSWMGSDLTNDDIVQDSSLEEDYDSTVIGRSENPPGWLMRLDAKPDMVGLWNRIDIVFEEGTGLPLMTQSYDRKDRLSRTMLFEDVQVMGGRRVPTVMRIIPEREEGRSTEFRYLSLDFNVDLSGDTFSLARLERSQ